MRFMVMHKVDAGMERGEHPAGVIAEMGKLVGESLASGVFEYGAGLHRSAERVRVTFERGERRLEPGPFSGRNELVDACFLVRATSREQALEQAARLASVMGDVELEVGLVIEPWDIGLSPKPAEPKTMRFLLLKKGDARSERGVTDERTTAALAELTARLRAEGVLLATETLAPSERGARLATGAKRTWVDGPFAESKELIAGFSVLRLPNRAEAIAWADRYAAVLGPANEVDVRELV
jgi:hypothetical protein